MAYPDLRYNYSYVEFITSSSHNIDRNSCTDQKKKKKGSYTLFTLPNFLVPKGIGFPLRINAEVYLFPFLFFS